MRTIQLLDLFVLRANNYFDDHARVITAPRHDAIEGDPDHAGYVPPARTITDPGLDRSLLDESILGRLIDQRGLAIVEPPTKTRRSRKAKGGAR